MKLLTSFGWAIWSVVICGGVAGCDPSGDPDPEPAFCGGIAGLPCPTGQSCIDDPSDDCDPKAGGADCGGICVKAEACGDTQCAPGLVCCNPVMGICTKPGGVCIQ